MEIKWEIQTGDNFINAITRNIMYALSLRASNSFPFTNGRVWERTSIRREKYHYEVSSTRVNDLRRAELDSNTGGPFAGILLHVPTKYTSATFICILLSPFLGFFFSALAAVAARGRANLRPTLSPLAWSLAQFVDFARARIYTRLRRRDLI